MLTGIDGQKTTSRLDDQEEERKSKKDNEKKPLIDKGHSQSKSSEFPVNRLL